MTVAAPPVTVRLLLFAVYRDLAGGRSSIDVDIAAGSDVHAALDAARAAVPSLAALPRRPVVAVNREYADLATVLVDGDEVALLPPVAGG
jgi:molybdopterin converting factor small subunit